MIMHTVFNMEWLSFSGGPFRIKAYNYVRVLKTPPAGSFPSHKLLL